MAAVEALRLMLRREPQQMDPWKAQGTGWSGCRLYQVPHLPVCLKFFPHPHLKRQLYLMASDY